MCEFCENISELEYINNSAFKGWYPPKNKDQLVKYDDKFGIWSDGGGDPFMAGICVDEVKFCPKCGVDLREE